MEAQELKERIIIDEKIIDILEALGMHSIKDKGNYITCGMRMEIILKAQLFIKIICM